MQHMGKINESSPGLKISDFEENLGFCAKISDFQETMLQEVGEFPQNTYR